MVIRLTIVCEIPYRWLKCSSLNPCLNLQRVKTNSSFGFNCLGLPCLEAVGIFITPLIITSS